MKRSIVVASIILALGAAGAFAPTAYAQEEGSAETGANVFTTSGTPSGTAASPAPAGSEKIPTGFTGLEASKSYNWVMAFFMNLFGWLMGVAAVTLNYAVYYTVVTMGSYVRNLPAIGLVWQIMRDLGNIVLIFGFLAAGIATILDLNIYGWSSKALPKMLLAAIFINFSLFISEAVIDSSNLFATQFYNQINSGPAQPATSVTGAVASAAIPDERISNAIMAQLGLAKLFGGLREGHNEDILNGPWYVGFLGMLLFLMTAVVLFTLAFILIARFVILLYVIITAPIGFASWVIPNLSGFGKQWWDTLLKQAFTAPVLLLLLYVALRVILHPAFLTGFKVDSSSGWFEWFKTSGSYQNSAGLLLSFLVAIGLLLVVIMAAKKMSAFGAGWATKMAGKATFGAAALGASMAVNLGARGARKGLQRWAPTSRISQYGTRLLRPLETARMDVRQVPGVGKGLSALGASEAAKPIAKSGIARIDQGREWWKKSSEAAEKQYKKEARVPLLRSAVAGANQNDINKAMRSLEDDDFKDKGVQNIVKTNAMAVRALSPKQASLMPDAILTEAPVYQNLNRQQLESIRNAGNMLPNNAQTIGAWLQTQPGFMTWLNGRPSHIQQDIKDFWSIP